jgi:hypothetical protein
MRCEGIPKWEKTNPSCSISPHRILMALISSLKGEVKKKHNSNGWIFFLLRSPLDEQDLF